MSMVCLQFVIVVFPDRTYLLFDYRIEFDILHSKLEYFIELYIHI